jgi:hypothetical protein
LKTEGGKNVTDQVLESRIPQRSLKVSASLGGKAEEGQ